jgi:hypothetical protein
MGPQDDQPTSNEEIQVKNVVYCGICGVPPEFCQFFRSSNRKTLIQLIDTPQTETQIPIFIPGGDE